MEDNVENRVDPGLLKTDYIVSSGDLPIAPRLEIKKTLFNEDNIICFQEIRKNNPHIPGY